MKKLQNLFILFFFLVPILSKAASPEWQIVPSQSSLSFTATQNGAPVMGQFKTFSGEIFVDPKNYQASSIHIIVDINSLTTSYADIKNTLTAPDWFNAQMFPTADFKAKEFKKIGDNKYQAIGALTIRGKTLPITLTFTATEATEDTGVVVGSAILKRNDFGVGQGEWSNTSQIKDEVKVDFKVVAKRKS